jgi:hypothetical protein
MNSKNLCRFLVFAILLTIAGLAGNAEPVRAQTAGPSFEVSFNPSGGQSVGNSVNIHIKVNSSNPGATRMNVSCGGVSKGETSEVEFDSTWHTDGCSAGTQQITIQARSPDDPNWSAPNTQTFNYSLTGGQPPAEPTSPPQPQGPSKGPNISTLELSPSGGAKVGDQVDIHIRVDSGNPGATKINVSCGTISKVETSEVDFHSTWYTNGCPGGQARVDVLSRAVDDPNWSNPSSASKSYNLTAPPADAPTANLSVDADTIQQGQCTTLRWNTSNANDVRIDGNGVSASGNKQICPNVTTRYTLVAKGPGGTAERNVTVVVKSQPKQNSVASSFNTGDVIDIGGSIYVIVNGERRHVPNPETLDALGITRSMINNRGFSDAQLNTIPQGPDIPDVKRDPSGFQEFKNWIFPNLSPIVPAESTPIPKKESEPTKTKEGESPIRITPSATAQEDDPDLPPEGEDSPRYFWCYLWPDGPFCRRTKASEPINLTCSPQCVPTARWKRPDLNDWASNVHNPDDILEVAKSGKKYTPKGQTQEMQVRVRGSGEQPQVGDIAIWPGSCVGGNGHIGYVSGINPFRITDSNWGTPWGDTKCWTRDNKEILQNDCLVFIPPPFPVESNNPSDTPDKCSQYSEWWQILRWGWCKITGS